MRLSSKEPLGIVVKKLYIDLSGLKTWNLEHQKRTLYPLCHSTWDTSVFQYSFKSDTVFVINWTQNPSNIRIQNRMKESSSFYLHSCWNEIWKQRAMDRSFSDFHWNKIERTEYYRNSNPTITRKENPPYGMRSSFSSQIRTYIYCYFMTTLNPLLLPTQFANDKLLSYKYFLFVF